MSTDRTSRKRRGRLSILIVLGLMVSSVVVLAGAGEATGNKWWGKTAIALVDVWTNDDGRVNGDDVGDVGDISPVFDNWRRRSSNDPATAEIDADRVDKDVARCKASIKRRHPRRATVKIWNAYPGYVCTISLGLMNQSRYKLRVWPELIDADPGITVTRVSDPIATRQLRPWKVTYGEFAIEIENTAPQNQHLEFEIEFWVTKARKWCKFPGA